MNQQSRLIMYGFTLTVLFSILINAVLLPMLLLAGLPVTLTHAYFINIFISLPVTILMAWRFKLTIFSSAMVGHISSLFWVFLNDIQGTYVLIQKPLYFIIFLILFPWRSTLVGLSGGLIGKFIDRKIKN